MEDVERPWLKYYNPKHMRDSIDYPDISMYEIVRRVAVDMPEKVA